MSRTLPPWTYDTIDGANVVKIGNETYPVDVTKPPAFLFATYFEARIGQTWLEAQQQLDPNARHSIVDWFNAYDEFLRAFEGRGVKSAYRDLLTPQAVALLLLAFDMYSLDRDRMLQQALIERLTDRRAFQGALHEISVAATMMRAGFALHFENESDSTRKHPEFIAMHPRSGHRIAVEAKSIHRSGVLASESGNPPPTITTANAHKIAAQVCGQVERALPKAGDLPLYVFVDLNLPCDVADEFGHSLFPELKSILPQVDVGLDTNGAFAGRTMNLLTVTNRPTNVGELRHRGGDTLNLFLHPEPKDCRYPEGSAHIPDVKEALKVYGTVSAE